MSDLLEKVGAALILAHAMFTWIWMGAIVIAVVAVLVIV